MYERFAELLQANGLNAYRVSKATGISNSTFYEWKAGRYKPKVDKLQKIADFFGVPVNYFLDAA